MTHLIRTVCAATAVACIAGCAATGSPEYDARFGDGVRALQAQQLIDPKAPVRHSQSTPPTDGRTTREAIARHGDTYRDPPPTNVINIGVGAGGNGK